MLRRNVDNYSWTLVVTYTCKQVCQCKVMNCFVLILLSRFMKQTTCTADCHPWFIPNSRSSTNCSFRGSPTPIKCGRISPLLQFGCCMCDLQQCKWRNKSLTMSIHCTLGHGYGYYGYGSCTISWNVSQ